MKILVLHGPNLGLLGAREPKVYGKVTLKNINAALVKLGGELRCTVVCIQSNHEGEMVDIIGNAPKTYQGIIINPAAYTHTSIAIRDAAASISLPVIEVHLSNIYGREDFRRTSLIAPVTVGQISGFGAQSYYLALRAMADLVKIKTRT
ncbi:MAG: type II 3-dehydroquinate dehydratase [bacterium]